MGGGGGALIGRRERAGAARARAISGDGVAASRTSSGSAPREPTHPDRVCADCDMLTAPRRRGPQRRIAKPPWLIFDNRDVKPATGPDERSRLDIVADAVTFADPPNIRRGAPMPNSPALYISGDANRSSARRSGIDASRNITRPVVGFEAPRATAGIPA